MVELFNGYVLTNGDYNREVKVEKETENGVVVLCFNKSDIDEMYKLLKEQQEDK